jgi:hypothetical protein
MLSLKDTLLSAFDEVTTLFAICAKVAVDVLEVVELGVGILSAIYCLSVLKC